MRLKPGGSTCCRKRCDEGRPVDEDRSLAAMMVGAHAQPHPLGIDADDALVGDGHAVRVARQVVQHQLGAGQRRLGIDHPVVTHELLRAGLGAPPRCWPDREATAPTWPARRSASMNLPLNTRDSACTGNKNVGLRLGAHQCPSRIQCAAGHQRMHMEVAAQILRPGVQHQREGADAAEPARVGGELAERRGHALHQRVVHPARMELRQVVELVRQREDQVAVRHRQQLGQRACRQASRA